MLYPDPPFDLTGHLIKMHTIDSLRIHISETLKTFDAFRLCPELVVPLMKVHKELGHEFDQYYDKLAALINGEKANDASIP